MYGNWSMSSSVCKSTQMSYLFGDVNLTDVSDACNQIQGEVTGPSWLGVAKEIYISVDRGTILI